MRVKKGDKVVVIAGHEKGKEGVVLSTNAAKNQVLVEGINKVTKHNKPNQQNQEGSITTKEAPIDASNVALIDPKTKKATKVYYKFEEKTDAKGNVKNVKVRYAKSGAKLDK